MADYRYRGRADLIKRKEIDVLFRSLNKTVVIEKKELPVEVHKKDEKLLREGLPQWLFTVIVFTAFFWIPPTINF